jgi:hypothetical protein
MNSMNVLFVTVAFIKPFSCSAVVTATAEKLKVLLSIVNERGTACVIGITKYFANIRTAATENNNMTK